MLGSRPDGLGCAASPLGFALFDALAFLHGNGVVHGDLKPSNVFLAPEGRIALLDFNAATVTPLPGAACSHVTQGLRESLHLPSYSLRYASPERLQGGRPSMADDVYSSCCAFYEIIAGAHPFGRRSALEAMNDKVPFQRPPWLTFTQWTLIRRGLSFAPDLRPPPDMLRDVFSPKGLLSAPTNILKILPLFRHGGRNAAAQSSALPSLSGKSFR
jgi:serine/threonine-protein kinase Stk1